MRQIASRSTLFEEKGPRTMSRFSLSLQACRSLLAQNPTRRWSCVGQLKPRINQSIDQSQFLGGFNVERGSGSVCDGGELWCFAARLGE